MSQFGSLITAMVSPFKQGDVSKLDFAAAERLVAHLIANNSDSIVVSGTTGESPTLSHDEEVELFKVVKIAANKINPQTKIIFGAGSNSTETVIAMSRQAAKLNADGLLIVTPYYNKPNQKGLKQHYSSIAKSTDLPIILYNVPGRCVVSLQSQSTIALAREYSNIVAIKEASTNIDSLTELRLALGERFAIYCGDDSLTLPMLSVGADGVISVASHIVGKQMSEMISYFRHGDNQKALQIHQKLYPLFQALFTEPNPTCIKAILGIMGVCDSSLREPLISLEDFQVETLKSILASVAKAEC
jgi:4-hydroxy-tetrahydrodipicolinate synthase